MRRRKFQNLINQWKTCGEKTEKDRETISKRAGKVAWEKKGEKKQPDMI